MRIPEKGSLWWDLTLKNVVEVLDVSKCQTKTKDLTPDIYGHMNSSGDFHHQLFNKRCITFNALIKLLYLGE
jgi:hypothetical protein